MSEGFASCAGQLLTSVRLHVSGVGPWWADCDFAEAPTVSGSVELLLGGYSWRGTVLPESSGAFGERRTVRIVGGAGGWGSLVPARSYRSDSGVKARDVVADCAREVGETLGGFVPGVEQLGDAYARSAGSATTVIEDAIHGAAWWVDAAGVTQVGSRPAAEPKAGSYELLAFDPRSRCATLAVDDVLSVGVGSVIRSELLEAPQTVSSLEIRVTPSSESDPGGLRVFAWCNSPTASRSRLAALLQGITRQVMAAKLHGLWRYRVLNMAGDRVDLQVVSADAGLPDLVSVAMSHGGIHQTLALGAIVEVAFVEGDRAQPRIFGYPGKGETGHVPTELSICGGTAPAAFEGCWVDVTIPTGTELGSNGSGPAITVLPIKLIGFVQGGRQRVRI